MRLLCGLVEERPEQSPENQDLEHEMRQAQAGAVLEFLRVELRSRFRQDRQRLSPALDARPEGLGAGEEGAQG